MFKEGEREIKNVKRIDYTKMVFGKEEYENRRYNRRTVKEMGRR